ncbi:MAG: glycosyltransferase [Proteobacteria bacterium]|nr:glycosyltransferase [Pseudomonadota bacterium]
MRIVLVNHCHPDTPHVCATRMREFAHALAGLGHQVLLLTETLNPTDPGSTPQEFQQRLIGHDFAAPLLLACPPCPNKALARLRQGTMNWLSRKVVILNGYLRHNGVFTDWREGAIPFISVIADHFSPNVTVGSFGNTDCWNIARDIARRADCPWVADIKDYWHKFIPGGLRDWLAHRFSDAAAMTSLSYSHIDEAAPWFRMPKHSVFSGFKAEILEATGNDNGQFKISLTGAIYDQRALDALMSGLAQWLDSLDAGDRENLVFVYAGSDDAAVRRAAERLADKCKTEYLGFVDLQTLHQLHRDCRVNLYVNSDNCFHHKVLELLAAGRPILCYPAEMPEAMQLAATTGGTLHSCDSPAEVVSALQAVKTGSDARADRSRLRAYAWEAQAEKFAGILHDVVTGASR